MNTVNNSKELQMANVYAIHPLAELSEKVKLLITDVESVGEFSEKWHKEDQKYWREFGYDLPLWTRGISFGASPRKHIKMTFAEYIKLLDDYITAEAANR